MAGPGPGSSREPSSLHDRDRRTPIDVIRLGTQRPRREELRLGTARHLLALLAVLSHRADLAVGCTCAEEARCHRSVLRELLVEHGAVVRGRV